MRLAERDRSPSTLIGYRRHAKLIEQKFGRMNVGEIQARDIERWYTDLMAAGTTPNNLRHTHRVLSASSRTGGSRAACRVWRRSG